MLTRARAAVLLGISALGLLGEACNAQKLVCSTAGINDPSNRTMRRDILNKGLDEFCAQMLVHDAPLKMAPDAPVIGRFFPAQCRQRETESGNLVIDFAGWGYAFTPMSKKVTFTAAANVEYDQDFRCSDDAMYAYFRTKRVNASGIQPKTIEILSAPFAQVAAAYAQQYAQTFGNQLLGQKLAEGFTVIRDPDGNVDMDLGILPLGQRPSHPFAIKSGSKITYENLRTEVHQEQRDFIGPIKLEKSAALYLTAQMDGTDAVDIFVLPQQEGEAAAAAYFNAPQATPLPQPRLDFVVRRGENFVQTVPLPAGMYYVVIDNTSSAGQAMPPQNPLDDRAAVVNYVVQIGEAP